MSDEWNRVTGDERLFAALLTNELTKRQRTGAELLAPGKKTWEEAFPAFMHSIKGGPIQARDAMRAAITRLHLAQTDGCCVVNAYLAKSKRSAIFELLTYEASKHPLLLEGREGVLVRSYHCRLQRTGRLSAGRAKLAFLSWHSLARMGRSGVGDIFDGAGIVSWCGYAGLLMRMSEKHHNTSISLSTEEMTAVGVLRQFVNAKGQGHAFFDVLTVLPPDADKPYQIKQRAQGSRIAHAVYKYIHGNDANTDGYADDIPVISFDHHDYVSTQLKRKEQDDGEAQAQQEAAGAAGLHPGGGDPGAGPAAE